MTDVAGARVASVEAGSPAWDAGFEAGCVVTAVDGQAVRDVIDWRWLAADGEVELSYVDNDGDAGTVVLEREPGEDWGLSFDGVIFDGVRTCRNACTFCFMRQLPEHMRPSLSLRDDDFRLSFLTGTFATLTNLREADVERIVAQRLSPLRVSLHAVDAQVRRALIGRHAEEGIANLERLLAEGIEFDAQVVLVPGRNDGAVLDETLAWAYARRGIRNVGVVPLGFTAHQCAFDESFDEPQAALRVIGQLEPWQRRALEERGTPWAFAADEFYRNAYGERLLEKLPDAAFYGDFSMFEDGIGIIRTMVDALREARSSGGVRRCLQALSDGGMQARYVCGEAMEPYASQLFEEVGLAPALATLPVRNDFFGGNVNVTGLLCGCDIARAIARAEEGGARGCTAYFVPAVVLNDDGVTLDGWTLDDVRRAAGPEIGRRVHLAPSNPIDYTDEIARVLSRSLGQ